MRDLPIVAAGREVPNALDQIRRYCGLHWSGGPPETWAWAYYDAIPTSHDDVVTPVDVVSVAALHPGLSKEDLTFFRESARAVSAWLSEVPTGQRLFELSDAAVEHVATLPDALAGPSVSFLSKVLHRKRPHVVPLLDRHIVDWYRPVTGKRAHAEAWGPLVRSIHDEEGDDERRLMMSIALNGIEQELWPDAGPDARPRLSWLRAIDIAIWMGTR